MIFSGHMLYMGPELWMRTVVYMGLELYYIMRDFLWELWLVLLLVTLSPKAEELKALEPMTRAI